MNTRDIIQDPFPPHKVKLKSINCESPSWALEYILAKFNKVAVTVNKQRVYNIIITIRCGDSMYELIKLDFVKDMGRHFLWKD